MLNRLDLVDFVLERAGKYDKQILEGLVILSLDSDKNPIPISKSDLTKKLNQSGSTLSPHINSLIEKQFITVKITNSEKLREKHQCSLSLLGFCYLILLKWGEPDIFISSTVPESYKKYITYFSHNQHLHPAFSLVIDEMRMENQSGRKSYINELVWVLNIACAFWYRWFIHYEFKKESIVYRKYYFEGNQLATFWYYLIICALDQCSHLYTREMIIEVLFPKLKLDRDWPQLEEKFNSILYEYQIQIDVLKDVLKPEIVDFR
ncbi:hypothetical protein Mhun_2841 [Methanospirillum hungatei JF-1]|uniref:Uncharacterized protein n=1 Tax=Methanospirillum hungatei JF-1 (strain ATCC 27890 / DSM 864 / NBRC 100397 / JF-1) TaxID=323259 RepID=Q2FSQ6_METHJ|nr:hypothetical protein [Methanospirillum hungatei]ABD42533.1 hypothetical protein Mhun_2841 [Methanospirillum hungatei JF-1]